MEKELLKGTIDIIILLLISKEDMYGYELAKEIKTITNNFYKMSEGTLYPALKRLEEKKLIESYWGGSVNAARRKYYNISSVGKKELNIKLEQWYKINELIDKCVKEAAINE